MNPSEDPTRTQPANSQSAAAPQQTASFVPLAEAGGIIAGRYTLIERIGEGGMGEVWVARQSEPIKRKVAVKLIKKGMDSQSVLARFEVERQALAVMDHPHIAKILDGGVTEAGAPFFVMELVAGRPLTQFCDEAHLSIPDRLSLFIGICQAVQHAHQKGIVHRDLKPSNILVTLVDGKPTPKIIDFGVAKALSGRLSEQSLSTQFGAMIGTLEYMAPEQTGLTTQDVDTRADVYTLGVILYELLTGLRPFDPQRIRRAAFDEVLRILREEDPPSLASRLSTDEALTSAAAVRQLEPRRLLATVRGELDWIVLRCLEKDRNRRYETASALARDIERYLTDEPVEARPASAGYRLRKLYRRNRGAMIAATLVLLVLVGGIIGTTWGLIRAEQQRKIAEDNEQQAATAKADAETRAKAEEQAKFQAWAETQRAEHEKARADDQAEQVRQALYAVRQQLAMNAWRENRAEVIAEMVERQKPEPGKADLRGFEWGYLDQLARAPGKRWQQLGMMINGVAIAPDNKTAVTVGFDGKATAWDVATGQKKWDTGDALRISVNAAAISPDGKTLALAGHFGQLQLWNLDGTLRIKLPGHRAQVFGVAFSPDGKTLASASADITVRFWDVEKGTSAGLIGADDLEPGTRQVTNPAESVGHTNMIWQAKWSPDGKRLATCSTDGSIKIWAMPERKLLRTLVGHEGIVVAVAWSPDGKLLAGASRPLVGNGGGELKLWNPDTGRAEATMRPPSGGLHAVAFTPDGLFIVIAGDRTVRVWRKDGRQVAEHRGFRGPVIGLAVGGEGRWAVAGTATGEIVAFELDTAPGKRSIASNEGVRLAVAPDGGLAACRYGEVTWYDPETLSELATWPAVPVPEPKQGSKVYSGAAAFTMRTDGQSAHNGHGYIGPGTVVWRDAAGKVRHLLSGHDAPITALAFLSGDRLASADENGAIHIWDGASGKSTAEIKAWDGPVRFLATTAYGQLWAGGALWQPGSKPDQFNRPVARDGRLVRIANGQIAAEENSASAPVAADVSPGGGTLIVACANDTLLWLDARTGKELRRKSFVSNPTPSMRSTPMVVSLRFSPKEPRLAVGLANGGVQILHAISGEELLMLEGGGPMASLAFLPDGRRLAVATGAFLQGGEMAIWDGRPAPDPPPLPSPDLTWHKSRLAAAADSGGMQFGPATRDQFASRYHLERLAALEPNELQWQRRLLALDQDADDFRAAAARLDRIVRQWPDNAPMWYDLGNARRELGDVADAEAAFRKCIALDPTMPEAHCNLGLLLGREGRFKEAVEFISRGHELGMIRKRSGKSWPYPSAAWLERHKRLNDLAAKYGDKKEFTGVPEADRGDLVDVLTLIKRPLAAIRLADPKPDKSPGPDIIGTALRCGAGIGDAASLSDAERSAWRAKALAWLRLDFESFRALAPLQRSQRCLAMRSHPMLRLARTDAIANWPAAEREAWQQFWADVDAAVEAR